MTLLGIVQVDGACAAVRFNRETDAAGSSKDDVSLLQDCRLLRKDELQVCVLKLYCFMGYYMKIYMNSRIRVILQQRLIMLFIAYWRLEIFDFSDICVYEFSLIFQCARWWSVQVGD